MEESERQRVCELIEKAGPYDVGILSPASKNALSVLDITYPVPDRQSRFRDYRGLAALFGCSNDFIERLQVRAWPTSRLISDYVWPRDDRSCGKRRLSSLLDCLMDLERFDVLEDAKCFIEKDIDRAKSMCEALRKTAEVTLQGPSAPTTWPLALPRTIGETDDRLSSDAVTVGDIQHYDAFVSYADDDWPFVEEIIQRLEVEMKCRLLVPDRDILLGVSRDSITAELIEKRCTRVIVILSRAFLKCEVCEFQIKFAHCLSPGSRGRRLIPVKVDKEMSPDSIPNILRFISLCDYTKNDLRPFFWPRLADSVKSHGVRRHNDVKNSLELSNTFYPKIKGGSSKQRRGKSSAK